MNTKPTLRKQISLNDIFKARYGNPYSIEIETINGPVQVSRQNMHQHFGSKSDDNINMPIKIHRNKHSQSLPSIKYVEIKNKNIVVFGANGMLGRYVYSHLQNVGYNVIAICRDKYDVINDPLTRLETIVKENQGSYIINCIGLIPQKIEQIRQTISRKKAYYEINSIFPHKLALLAEKYNCMLIHISTDCVYSGNSIEGNYVESDESDEIEEYGLSKAMGEPENCCIIRTSIIGEEIENRVSLLEWVKKNSGKTINGFINCYWNGITCLQLAKIIEEMMKPNFYFWKGVRHIFSPNHISKYDLICLINDIYGCNAKINATMFDKRINKTLSTIYDKRFEIPKIDVQLKELLLFSP